MHFRGFHGERGDEAGFGVRHHGGTGLIHAGLRLLEPDGHDHAIRRNAPSFAAGEQDFRAHVDHRVENGSGQDGHFLFPEHLGHVDADETVVVLHEQRVPPHEGDLVAVIGHEAGGLAADIAAADHHRAFSGKNRDVVQDVDGERDMGFVHARHLRDDLRRTDGDHEGVGSEFFHDLRGDLGAEPQFHRAFLQFVLHPVERARHIGLERGTAAGIHHPPHIGHLVEYGHIVPAFRGGEGAPDAGGSRADDHDLLAGGPPGRVPAPPRARDRDSWSRQAVRCARACHSRHCSGCRARCASHGPPRPFPASTHPRGRCARGRRGRTSGGDVGFRLFHNGDGARHEHRRLRTGLLHFRGERHKRVARGVKRRHRSQLCRDEHLGGGRAHMKVDHAEFRKVTGDVEAEFELDAVGEFFVGVDLIDTGIGNRAWMPRDDLAGESACGSRTRRRIVGPLVRGGRHELQHEVGMAAVDLEAVISGLLSEPGRADVALHQFVRLRGGEFGRHAGVYRAVDGGGRFLPHLAAVELKLAEYGTVVTVDRVGEFFVRGDEPLVVDAHFGHPQRCRGCGTPRK